MTINTEPLGRLGRYLLVRSLGKGGMGEVFLAFDESCKRHVALKRIRDNLKKNPIIQNRFLREARIAAQLSHPNIISIHAIEQEEGVSFYTMPFIEGETLRSILKKARLEESQGLYNPLSSPLLSLLRIFLHVCEAIAYCHAKGILHRDLKPENVLIGKYGETMIVDWGLAQYFGSIEDEENSPDNSLEEEPTPLEWTRPGKVVGTLAYMAPERAMREPATFSTDIYALGAILYQILTLRMPFKRESLKAFREEMHREKLIDPIEAAPYRDIPPELAKAACRCLSFDKEARFSRVVDLIDEIERYNKGLPEWMPAAVLDVHNKNDWEFQEHVMFARHFAIARKEGALEWVWMMISKASLLGNFKIEAKLKLEEKSQGIQFLFGIPTKNRLSRLEDGYSLWLGSLATPGCTLSRARIEVLTLPSIHLDPEKWHILRIEKIDGRLCGYLDDKPLFQYTSPLPIIGSHIGVITHDSLFSIDHISLFSGSHNALVNCLAVPDAFLERAEYAHALTEYRKIAFCFKGRSEGYEGLFRAGLTLLEEAHDAKTLREKKRWLEEASLQFGFLRKTPAAPLEYLGKSLTYRLTHDTEEEAKCLELAMRKYSNHPLLSFLQEQTLFRMHEACHKNRKDAYIFARLALQRIPKSIDNPQHLELIHLLYADLERVPFFENRKEDVVQEELHTDLSLQLAFWTGHERVLQEIGAAMQKQPLSARVESNWWFAMLQLGYPISASEGDPWQSIAKESQKPNLDRAISLYLQNKNAMDEKIDFRIVWHLLHYSLDKVLLKEPVTNLQSLYSLCDGLALTPAQKVWKDSILVRLFLATQLWEKADALFQRYPLKDLQSEAHPLFASYGCYLSKIQGKEAAMQHFSDLSMTLCPATEALLGHYLLGRKTEKIAPFLWQSKELLRQLALFYTCAGDLHHANTFAKKIHSNARRTR